MSGREVTFGEYRAEGDNGPELQVDQGGQDLGTAELYCTPGEDSPPLDGDWGTVVMVDTGDHSTETMAAVGYSDDTERVSERGEKRIYGRDSDGNVTSSLHLRGDDSIELQQSAGPGLFVSAEGEIKIENDNGSFLLETSGKATIENNTANVVIGDDGSITLDAAAGSISIDPSGAISLSGVSVSLQNGTSLGVHLTTLHTALVAWVPAPMDGGAALKAALAPYLAQTPPGP